MNTWVRRGVGTVVLSAGLVAAGSTAAQASQMPFGGSGFNLGQWGTNYQAGQSNSIIANPTQNGLINLNVVAGNLQFNNSNQQVSNNAFGNQGYFGNPGLGSSGFSPRRGYMRGY